MDGTNPEVNVSQKVPGELRKIGYFRVTERSLNSYSKLGHINPDTIPSYGVVVNIGSGFEQRFEHELKQRRPDLSLLPIDPSLAIPAEEKLFQEYKNQGVVLEIKPDGQDIREPTEDERQKRLTKVLKTSIAAVAQNLPIKSSGADLVIDLCGAFFYLPTDGNERRDYISELFRILRTNGEAHIYPVEYYGENVETSNPGQRIENERKKLEEILEGLQINHEFYEEIDPHMNEKRLGLIIKK